MSGRVCPLCETPWQDAEGMAPCLFCGTGEEAEFRCRNGHYVCEECRTADPREFVVRVSERSQETDPLALWNLITAHAAFRGHGPQFHFVVLPVLATVLRNRGVKTIPRDLVRKAVERLAGIPALSCAEVGVCGAGANAGALLSLLTGATPVSDRERRTVLTGTARVLREIGTLPGGRCCRQSGLATLEATWDLLRRELGFPLEPLTFRCRHPARVPDCKPGCVYHE